jgi:hypothetical protein
MTFHGASSLCCDVYVKTLHMTTVSRAISIFFASVFLANGCDNKG